MNIKKVTTYLLKLYRKGEKLLKAQYEDGYLITDGYKMFYLKEDELEINPRLIKDDKRIIGVWESATKNCHELNYKVSRKVGRNIIDKYSNNEHKLDIYIYENMLNFFDLFLVKLYGSNPLEPIVVKMGEESIAVICPIRISGAEF